MSIEKNIQTVKDFFAAIGRGDLSLTPAPRDDRGRDRQLSLSIRIVSVIIEPVGMLPASDAGFAQQLGSMLSR